MEVVTLGALVGLGYVVSRISGEPAGGGAGADSKQPCNTQLIQGPASKAAAVEGFLPAARGPDTNSLTQTPKGASAVGLGPGLDMMFQTLNGQTYPSEPNPGPHGLPTGYATQQPPIQPRAAFPEMGGDGPRPMPLDSQRAMVEMRSDGVEEEPAYVDGDYVVSPLTGMRMPSAEFRHNNMVPFFGGRVKQNISPNANQSRLDTYTGSGTTQITKKEIAPMFDTAKTPFGNPFGSEHNVDFIQSRINDPRSRNGERPFEPTRVGPALNEGFGMTGKGGFQQFEIDEIMKRALPTTDKLRVADKPKLTYNQPVVPGQHFVGQAADDAGEVRKYRPDTFYIDENGERFFTTTGALIKDAARPTQILNHTTRPETSTDYTGPAQSQDFQESYVTGSYRTPMTKQYGGAGYRNADMTGYYTTDVDAPEADYGRMGYENRPNERTFTSERVMGLNLAPAEAGANTIHYDDPSRPTRRAETIGNIRQTGTPVGYAGGVPAITVWDPTDVARTTVKEGTIDRNYLGIMGSGSAPNRLKVYDPDDIARPTQKSQLSARDYYGPSVATSKDFTSHDAAYNMRTNSGKEQIARGRKPIAGAGGMAVFTGEINQTTKKLDADYINDRANAVNRVVEMTAGAADIGSMKYRLPLELDVSTERNQPFMVSSIESNPYNQSLRKNAEADERAILQRMAGVQPLKRDF